MSDTNRFAFTPNSAAAALDISRSKIYALMKTGQLRYVLIGSDRRIPADEVARLARDGSGEVVSNASHK